MNQTMRNLIGIFVLLAASFSVVYSQSLTSQRNDGPLVEEFSFLINDFKMDH